MTEMPWIKWLDLETTTGSDGTLTVTLARPKAEHLNHNGAINAAVAYGVAEVAGAGVAVLGVLDLLENAYTAVESGTIRYSAPAHGGITATGRFDPSVALGARGAVVRGEAVELPVQVVLADLDGRSTGVCELTIALRPRRSHERRRAETSQQERER